MSTNNKTISYIIRIFLIFLKKNRCYNSFAWNFCNGTRVNKKDLERFLEDYNITDLIDCTFTWRQTEQGYDYWQEIDDKWVKCVHRHHLEYLR